MLFVVFLPVKIMVYMLSIGIVVFIRKNFISHLTMDSILWMANWNSSAVCQIWVIYCISMEWHVRCMVNILLPVMNVLMWLKILVEMLISSMGCMIIVVFVEAVMLNIMWVAVVNLIVWSQKSVHKLVFLIIMMIIMVSIMTQGKVEIVVILVVLWDSIVVIIIIGWCWVIRVMVNCVKVVLWSIVVW